jgi:hypothetical protein
MSKQRKPLDQILGAFEEDVVTPSLPVSRDENIPTNQNSLAAQLAQPSRKKSTIRFTLDLEKSLDRRLTQSAARLNRSKADLVRIAVNRLLEELEA